MPLAYFVDNFSPFLGPHWGVIGIRYYGLGYILGFLAGAWLLFRFARSGRSLLPAAQVWDFMYALVIGVYAGGRLGYLLLYTPKEFLHHPWIIIAIWGGGMASHGGMIGVALAVLWFAHSRKIPFFHLGDLVVAAAPPGLFLVRLANFINGELWGKISHVPWAVIFPNSAPDLPITLIPPRHPSQLYEACLEGLLLFAIMQWRFWRTDVVKRQPGRLSGEFVAAYAIVRIFCERFREPDGGDISLILGLSRGTFYSLIMLLAGLVIILVCSRRRPACGR